MTIHHEFRKGQKVMVIFKDGRQLVGKFSGDYGRDTLNLESRKISYKHIRAVTIYKPLDKS